MNDWDEKQRKLTRALVGAGDEAEDLAQNLRRFLDGDLAATPPEEAISLALDVQGGILCAPLHYLGQVDPRPEDVPFLTKLARVTQQIFDIGHEVARRIHIPGSFLKRFTLRPFELFTPDFFRRRRAHNPSHRQAERQRIVTALCRTVRRFLEWLRQAFRRLMDGLDPDAIDAPIYIAPNRRQLVDTCDRHKGLVVLRDPNGVLGARCFSAAPSRNKVWGFLRLLVGTNDPEGDVALPTTYATHFRGDDDLCRLLRHIHPSRNRIGHYHLDWDPKPPLLRER